jgi:acyl transferase domain-containing protein
MDTENSDHRSRSIAIIGMSGRFPGANSLEAFWQNVLNGVESITFLKDEELEDSPLTPDLRGDPFHVKAAAPPANAEYFDAALFSITPREADLMDPQHRVFMECA